MTDFEHILPLWRELRNSAADYVLATVVAVQGSSYRQAGARMLLAPDGRRAGTVSGGCLEAEVAKKAWWLTENGPVVERYSTLEEDGDLPYGSGCGGVIFILLERSATARPLLEALHAAFNARVPLAIATVLAGPHAGYRIFAGPSTPPGCPDFAAPQLASWEVDLQQLACDALDAKKAREEQIVIDGVDTRVWVDYRSARPGLWIFGAGDDTKPLHKLARELGWFVAIADGRSHLVTPSRFPAADLVIPLQISELPGAPGLDSETGDIVRGSIQAALKGHDHEALTSQDQAALKGHDFSRAVEPNQLDRALAPEGSLPPDAPDQLDIHPGDAAVLATHSYEQDTHILAFLLARAPHQRPAYIGILGPQRRTREALAEAARLLNLVPTTRLVEQWLDDIHGPTGLDLGADTPASIALSILAEIQKSLTAATALPLKQVRATKPVTAA